MQQDGRINFIFVLVHKLAFIFLVLKLSDTSRDVQGKLMVRQITIFFLDMHERYDYGLWCKKQKSDKE